MNISTNRLKTFTEHQPPWPYLNNKKYHKPEEFSNAGFYNVATDKIKDELKCYLCDMVLNRWKEGQSPLARHALAKPKCPLVLLNFPDALSTVSFDEANPDTYPESDYMTAARIQTFTKDKAWPPSSSAPSSSTTTTTTKRQTRSSTIIRQKPYPTSTKLAEAGFIFLPTEKEHDRVFCPYCHCTLSNLRGVTNSFTQHQKLKPQCIFILRWQAKRKKPSIPRKRSLPSDQRNKDKQSTSKRTKSLPSTSKRTSTTTTATAITATRRRRGTEVPSSNKATNKDNNDMNITDDDDDDDGDNNDDDEKERFDTALDDSIWDIAKADIGKRPFDLSQKRNKQSHTKTLVTYSRKDKDKNIKKILPPELTKPNNRSSSHRLSSIPPSKIKTAETTDGTTKPSSSSPSPSTSVLNTTIASSSSKGPIIEIPSPPSTEETPAQVLKRLTTETNEPLLPPPITKKDKGKGRAIDSLPSTSNTTTEKKKTTSTRPSLSLNKNKNKNNSDHHDKSLQKEKETSKNTSIATTSSFSISSPPSLSSNNNNNNHSRSMNHYQPPLFPLAQSTPISSRIDNGDTDLFKLTLSPIRHTGETKTTTATTNTINRQHHGVFDNLNTPIMGDLRVQQYGSDELEIQKQIANRFRNKKRPLSPTTQHDDTNKNKDNKYSLFDEEDSPLSSIITPLASSASNPMALVNNNNNNILTENELKMTVEEFIHHLVEKKINLVQQHGESLIKSIEEEVRNTRNSILTNQ